MFCNRSLTTALVFRLDPSGNHIDHSGQSQSVIQRLPAENSSISKRQIHRLLPLQKYNILHNPSLLGLCQKFKTQALLQSAASVSFVPRPSSTEDNSINKSFNWIV